MASEHRRCACAPLSPLLLLALAVLSCRLSVHAQSSCADSGSFVSVLAPSSMCGDARNVFRDPINSFLYMSCQKQGILALPPPTLSVAGGDEAPANATVILSRAECASAAWVTRDAVNNITYAACNSGPIAVGPSGVKQALTAAGECAAATSIAIDPTSGVIYVTCYLKGVLAINGTTRKFLTVTSQCNLAQSVVVHPQSGAVYAACRLSGLVALTRTLGGNYTVVNLANRTLCSSARSVALAPSSGSLYLACYGANVLRVNVSSGAVSAAAPVGQCKQPTGVAVDATESTLYVSCFLNGVFATQTSGAEGSAFTGLATSSQCPSADGVSLDPLTGTVAAACGDGGVVGVRGTTVTALVNAGICPRPKYLVWHEGRAELLVMCAGRGLLQVDGTRVRTIITPSQCATGNFVLRDDKTGVLFVSCASGILAVQGGGEVRTLVPFEAAPGSNISCAYPGTLLFDPELLVLTAACFSANTGLVSLQLGWTNTSTSSGSDSDPDSGATGSGSGSGSGPGLVLTALSSTRIVSRAECDLPKHVWKEPGTGILYLSCEGQSSADKWTLVRRHPSGRVEGLMRSWECYSPQAAVKVPWAGEQVFVACQQAPGASGPAGRPAVRVFHLDTLPGGSRAGSGALNVSVLLGPDECDAPVSLEIGPGSLEGGGVLLVGCLNSGVVRVHMRSRVASAPAAAAPTGALALLPFSLTSLALSSAQCTGASAVSYHASTGVTYAACANAGAVALSEDFRCQAGFAWSQGACTPCDPGFFRAAASLVDSQISWGCAACASGSVAPFSAAARCSQCLPGTRADAEENLCTSCSPGRAQPSWGATICLECGVGSAMAGLGASSCASCAAGYHSERNGTLLCEACAPGRFQAEPGQSHCEDCAPGRFNEAPGQSSCFACGPGRFAANSSALSCSPCAPGTRQNGTGAFECAPCDPGSFASLPLATECAPCEPGSAAEAPGALSCTLCVPGTFQPSRGATECLPAQPGQFVARTGLPAVELCPVGTASDANRTVECVRCPRGSVQGERGASACHTCHPGKFSDVTGGSVCAECEPGSYAGQWGTVECAPCYPGSASNVSGLARECPPCQPGFFQAGARRATQCEPCGPSTFADQAGSAQCSFCATRVGANRTSCGVSTCDANTEYSQQSGECETCPLGSFSARGGFCSPCPLNLYTPHAGSGCISCQQSGMEGLVCVGGLASVREGYWAFLGAPDPQGTRLFVTAACPPHFCPGAQLQSLPATPTGGGDWSNSSSSHGNSTQSVQYCLHPRVNSPSNVLCGSCVEGYIPWNDKCVRCRGTNGPLLFGALVLSLALVLFLLRSSGGGSSAGGVAVLLYFVQTASLEVGSSTRYLAWLQVFNFGTESSAECIAPWSTYQQLVVSLCMPLLLLAELLAVALVHRALHGYSRAHPVDRADTDEQEPNAAAAASEKPSTQARPVSSWPARARLMLASLVSEFSWRRYVAACMSVLLFSYTQVTVACVSYLYCVQVGPQRVLFTAPTVDCDSREYRRHLVGVVVAFVVFVAGFPIAVVIGLWSHRGLVLGGKLSQQQQQQRTAAGLQPSGVASSDDDDCGAKETRDAASTSPSTVFQQTWGPLYSMFAPRALYWQPLVLLRRASFVLTSVLLVQQHSARFLVFGLLHFASLLAHLYVRPFVDEGSNRAETASYVLLVVMSGLLSGSLPPYSPAVQAVAFLLLVPPAATLAIIVLHQQWRDVHAKLNAKRGAALAEQLRREQELEGPVPPALALNPLRSSIAAFDEDDDGGATRAIDVRLANSDIYSPRSPSAGLTRPSVDEEIIHEIQPGSDADSQEL